MLTEFATVILYAQLLLTNPSGQRAGLLWTDDEMVQGFAWDPGVVAFGIPDPDGDCLVSVTTGAKQTVSVADDTVWAIAVPFTASADTVEVGTVLLGHPIPITPGRYQAVFQVQPGSPGQAFWLESVL